MNELVIYKSRLDNTEYIIDNSVSSSIFLDKEDEILFIKNESLSGKIIFNISVSSLDNIQIEYLTNEDNDLLINELAHSSSIFNIYDDYVRLKPNEFICIKLKLLDVLYDTFYKRNVSLSLEYTDEY